MSKEEKFQKFKDFIKWFCISLQSLYEQNEKMDALTKAHILLFCKGMDLYTCNSSQELCFDFPTIDIVDQIIDECKNKNYLDSSYKKLIGFAEICLMLLVQELKEKEIL